MKKIATYTTLLILLVLLLNSWNKDEPMVYQEVKKEELNISSSMVQKEAFETEEENKTKMKAIVTQKIEIQEDEGEDREVKYCLDRVVDFSRRGQKKEIFYRYGEDGSVDIEIDKDGDGKMDFRNHRVLDEEGSLLLEEIDSNGDGKMDRKRVHTYGSLGRLEEIETMLYPKDEREPIVDRIGVDYSQEEDIDDTPQGHEDIYQLIKPSTSRVLVDVGIGRETFEELFGGEYDRTVVEYHEEHDAGGKKVFAYAGSKEYKSKSFRYLYDSEGNLLSKTAVDYGFSHINTTTYFAPSGQIKEVYKQSNEELQEMIREKEKWYREKMDQTKEENRKLLSGIIYRQSNDRMNQVLGQKTFHQKLIKAYRYNEDGTLAEEFDNNDKNITYRYDAHGNLIEKKRGDKVLIKQFFKACQ